MPDNVRPRIDITQEEVQDLATRLVQFRDSLNPRQQEVLVTMLSYARDGMQGDVAGFEGGGDHGGSIHQFPWLQVLEIQPAGLGTEPVPPGTQIGQPRHGQSGALNR